MPFRDSFFRCYCGAQLGVRKTPGYTVRQCPACGGSWVDLQGFQAMLQLMEPSHRRAQQVQVMMLDAGASPRDCMACGKPMRRIHVEDEELDACASHGVWFDHPELSAVLTKYMDRDDA